MLPVHSLIINTRPHHHSAQQSSLDETVPGEHTDVEIIIAAGVYYTVHILLL
jgi:hypothetical protein